MRWSRAAEACGSGRFRQVDHLLPRLAPEDAVRGFLRPGGGAQVERPPSRQSSERSGAGPCEGEGEQVRAFFDHPQVLGSGATLDQIADAVRGRTYFHWIGHGSFEMDEPEDSGLRLADGRIKVSDLWERRIDLSE